MQNIFVDYIYLIESKPVKLEPLLCVSDVKFVFVMFVFDVIPLIRGIAKLEYAYKM